MRLPQKIAAVMLLATLLASSARLAEEKPAKDLVEILETAGQFKTLTSALEKAGLVESLKAHHLCTLFAPTDKAFAKVPKEKLDALLADNDKLRKLLKAHIIVGREVKAADLRKLNGEKVNGFSIDAKDELKIGAAKIIKADVPAKNGVIHVIDLVLEGM
jgi:uncharacterized surface protein with fasciclin (FAS1) repeats